MAAAANAAAAAAAAALEAQLQLAALHDHILPMVGFSNVGANPAQRQTNQFTTMTQLINLEMFQQLEFDQVKTIIKRYQTRYPNQNLGMLVQNNLTGIIWYVKDLVRRQQPILPDKVQLQDIVDGHFAYKAYVQNKEKGENMTKLPKYDDKMEFDEWFERVQDVLNMIYGSNLCPISYVVRVDKPDNWDPKVDARTNLKQLMYQLELAGPEFEVDNTEVFKLLKNSVNGTEAASYIEDYTLPQDGRGAMLELRRRFEGPNASDTRCAKALTVLESITYKNEKETPFEVMINKLKKAYVTLKKNNGQEFMDMMKVDALAKHFQYSQNQSITLRIALEQMRLLYRNNYRDAVSYLSSKLSEINAANKSITGNPRRISSSSRNSSTVSVRHASGDLITSWYGVDLTNPTRLFTTEEMRKLGFWGREIMKELRRLSEAGELHNAPTNTGGGGRGYHRGGRSGCGGQGGHGYGRGYYGGRSGRDGGYGRGGYNNNNNSNNSGGNRNNNDRQVNATERSNSTNNNAPESATSNDNIQNNNNHNQQQSSQRGGQNGPAYGS